jgi:hypothetical protein
MQSGSKERTEERKRRNRTGQRKDREGEDNLMAATLGE